MSSPSPTPETVSSDADHNDAATRSKPRPVQTKRLRPRFLPQHAIILHNDDVNGMDHVVRALSRVFQYPIEKSIKLMLQVHMSGRAIVWTGCLEVAELKADQLLGMGADPTRMEFGAQKLRVSIEPLNE